MIPANADKMVTSACNRHTKPLPFTLISELLATVFTDQNEMLLFQSRSQGFLYDSKSGMATSDMLQVKIEDNRIIEKEHEIEITLSGTLKNQKGLEETYTLYFFMWWDQTGSSPTRNNCRRTASEDSLVINTGNSSIRLSDSIFELDLYRKSLPKEQDFLGQGRGYLVFGRET